MDELEIKVFITLMLLGMLLSLVYLISANRFINLLKSECPKSWNEIGKPKDGFSHDLGSTKKLHHFFMKKEFINFENKELVNLGWVCRRVLISSSTVFFVMFMWFVVGALTR